MRTSEFLKDDVGERESTDPSVPGKLAKFGLDWETLHKLNPRLIYCSVTGELVTCYMKLMTGYGSTGPYAKNPGYDVVIEAEAGLMHITGERGGSPVKVSTSFWTTHTEPS